MPAVNNLTGNKSKGPAPVTDINTPQQGERQIITPKDVGPMPVTLIESNTNSPATITQSAELALPSFLQQDGIPELANNLGTEYVGFAHPMSKNWPQTSAAGVKEGQIFVLKTGQITPVDTLEYFLMVGGSYLTEYNDAMNLVYCSKDVTEENPNPKARGAHYIALMLVRLGETFVPIRGDFRTTKTNGIELAFRTLEAASKPDWLQRSEAHKATGAFRQPFGRVYHKMWTQPHMSPKTGRKSHIAKGSSEPATIAQMQKLVDLFSDPAFTKEVNASYSAYQQRIQFMNDTADKFKRGS